MGDEGKQAMKQGGVAGPPPYPHPATFRPRPRGFAPSIATSRRARPSARATGPSRLSGSSGSDPDRLAFVPGDDVVCFVNSTELRNIVAESGVFPRAGGQQGEFTLERKEEADAQNWCQ